MDFVKMDKDIRFRAQVRFANSFYGKFLRWPLPLEIVNKVIIDRWKEWGEVAVADLSNGYFLIHCSSQIAMQNICIWGPLGLLMDWFSSFHLGMRSSSQCMLAFSQQRFGCNSIIWLWDYGKEMFLIPSLTILDVCLKLTIKRLIWIELNMLEFAWS